MCCTAFAAEHSKPRRDRQCDLRIVVTEISTHFIQTSPGLQWNTVARQSKLDKGDFQEIRCVDRPNGCNLLCKSRKDCKKDGGEGKNEIGNEIARAFADWTGRMVLSGLERVCVPEKEAQGVS